VVMERLYKTTIDKQRLKDFGIDNLTLKNMTFSKHSSENIISERIFRTAFSDPKIRKHIYNTTKDKNLKQALRLLEPLFKHYWPDMHIGNIMQRSDNHLVFIDPVAQPRPTGAGHFGNSPRLTPKKLDNDPDDWASALKHTKPTKKF
jgi:hypothetical protein